MEGMKTETDKIRDHSWLAKGWKSHPHVITPTFHMVSQILLGNDISLDLSQAISEAGSLQPVNVSEDTKTAVHDFMTRRMEQLLVDSGIAVEVARAILSERANNPLLAKQSAAELQASNPAQSFSTDVVYSLSKHLFSFLQNSIRKLEIVTHELR